VILQFFRKLFSSNGPLANKQSNKPKTEPSRMTIQTRQGPDRQGIKNGKQFDKLKAIYENDRPDYVDIIRFILN
jgi:hypothetical protein